MASHSDVGTGLTDPLARLQVRNPNRSELRRRNAQARQAARHRHQERRRILTRDFLGSQSGLDGRDDWKGVKSLGVGGQGAAGLWVKLDDTNKIVDRMVVKEAQATEAFFNNPMTWKDGVLYGTPREADMNYVVTTNKNDDPEYTSSNVTIYGWSVQQDRHTYRLYLGYCPYGELWEMVSAQLDPAPTKIFGSDGTAVNQEAQYIPEPAIWHVFHSLANAAVNMKNPPHLPRDAKAGSNIVHMDIKPENVFLTDPCSNWFPKYPDSRIGDFGSAVLVYDNDPNNPQSYSNQPVTSGFLSPELFGYGPESPLLFGPWTNIYQIGMTIYACMVCNGSSPNQINFRGNIRRHADFFPDFRQLDSIYSEDLIAAVKDCLEPARQMRPTPEVLKARLERLMPSHLHSMNHPRYALFADRWPYLLHMELSDKYKVGMIHQTPPTTPSSQPQALPGSAAGRTNSRNSNPNASTPGPDIPRRADAPRPIFDPFGPNSNGWQASS